MDRIAPAEAGHYRQLALVKLTPAFTGHTHQFLLDYSDRAALILRRNYQNPTDAIPTLSRLEQAWGDAFGKWEASLHNARRQAAALAFGELAISQRKRKRTLSSRPRLFWQPMGWLSIWIAWQR